MSTYSTNLNRLFYCVNSVKDGALGTDAGNTKVNINKKSLYFTYINATLEIGKTDIIELDKIIDVKATAPNDMKIILKLAEITLQSGTTLISGEDYVVRINFRQLYGMSDLDIYQKYGAVHCTKAMESNEGLFWLELAYSLSKNFSKLYSNLLAFEVKKSDGNKVLAKKVNGTFYDTDGSPVTASGVTGIVVKEVAQTADYHLGTAKLLPVYFEVIPTMVYGDGGLLEWANVAVSNQPIDNSPSNGYQIADLEYFCMGERGDQYRYKGWPNYIPTKYMVTETLDYYTIDITYAWEAPGIDSLKSEKVMTLAIKTTSDLKLIAAALVNAGITVNATPGCEDDVLGESAKDNNGELDSSELDN